MAEIVIDRLGHRGDGVADVAGRSVFVPFALPGERVEVEIDGDRAWTVAILTPSPDRVLPPCPHFGTCGGCALQHLSPPAYAAFKRRIVVDALADRGLSPDVGEAILTPPGARRRATFAGIMAGKDPLVGFNARGSHRIVPIATCPVSLPALLGARPALEAITRLLQPRKTAIDLSVTVTTAGFDVAVSSVHARDLDRYRLPLIDLAGAHDLARLSVAWEVVVERRPPVVTIDGVPVVAPPGGFLQASAEAEKAIAGLVVEAAGGARRIADLFAGVGTFALRLARTATVYAAEGDKGAAAALDRAMRSMTGRGRITVEARDLARRPLVEKELDAFDAVVFDPPRAGAAEQSAWIAKSKVPTVVAVSCGPATLARD
ncbi:MAG TPA: TRAM domain-containing protein, partial [Methylomirabilota bacterium]|nr:TRAM domain-containing protein [Methylomirabilota bacterium]